MSSPIHANNDVRANWQAALQHGPEGPGVVTPQEAQRIIASAGAPASAEDIAAARAILAGAEQQMKEARSRHRSADLRLAATTAAMASGAGLGALLMEAVSGGARHTLINEVSEAGQAVTETKAQFDVARANHARAKEIYQALTGRG